jgi:outer membrane protein assembly factor BamE (lipoprotein component of BamABCDE complex)
MLYNFYMEKIYFFLIALFASIISGCHSAPKPTKPLLPSTVYIQNSKGAALPADMSPAQRLVYLNLGMTKSQIIEVMGNPHAAAVVPPAFECLEWLYLDAEHASMMRQAVVIIGKDRLIETNPSVFLGCGRVFNQEKLKQLEKLVQ